MHKVTVREVDLRKIGFVCIDRPKYVLWCLLVAFDALTIAEP